MGLYPGAADPNDSIGRFIFGDDAAGYQSARPGYPEGVYAAIATAGALEPGTAMFEIGPGTGQATRRLLEHRPAKFVAIEPDARFSSYLEDLASATGVAIHVQNEAFEAASLTDDTFDLGVAATSFHWLDEGTAFPRILRVLKPGGCWAMWWNIVHDPAADPFSRAVMPVLEGLDLPPSLSPDRHSHYALDAERRIRSLADAGFDKVEHQMLTVEHMMTAASLRALYGTFSMVRRLPVERREQLLDHVMAIAENEFGGSIRRVFRAPLYIARKPG